MRTDELKDVVDRFKGEFPEMKLQTITLPSGQLFKLSWSTGGEQRGYIDVFHDPQRNAGITVQHGTYDDQTKMSRPCGMTCLPLPQVGEHLKRLKGTIGTETPAPPKAPQWRYTPRVDIGNVTELKFR